MLALGIFCGKYMTDCRGEFPASWFAQARLSPSGRNCSLNYFSVDASQPLSVWRRKGWIHPDDPRGWFQWYSRYGHHDLPTSCPLMTQSRTLEIEERYGGRHRYGAGRFPLNHPHRDLVRSIAVYQAFPPTP